MRGQMSGEDVHLMLKTSISGVVRAVIAMGSSFDIKTTAEGIETPQQFNQLKLQVCTDVQGYLLSPPRPAAEVNGLLAAINPKLKAIA
jgi:EAL domain-containing protein (putative c-di-GMP-specific phosphodiesterase class I)